MLDHTEPRNDSNLLPVMFALVTSLFFGVLLWLWDRDLVWMLAALLPPIWTPVIYRRFGSEDDADAQSQSRGRAVARTRRPGRSRAARVRSSLKDEGQAVTGRQSRTIGAKSSGSRVTTW